MLWGIPYWAWGLLGASTLAAVASGESDSVDADLVKDPVKKVQFLGLESWLKNAKSGPLPPQALAAAATSSFTKGGPNDLHMKGAWFKYGAYSSNFFEKIEVYRIYSNPPGTIQVRSESDTFNLCWAAQCPDAWYPQYGYKNRGVRMGILKKLTGPKADWQMLVGGLRDLLQELPEMLETAGLIGAGVATGGQSVGQNPDQQVDQVLNTLEGIYDVGKGIGDSLGERKKAAAALVTSIGVEYRRRIAKANPWVLVNGQVKLGKRFMANPKTYADLYKPGKSRPLLYNPPTGSAFYSNWPNR